jgi:hypothetical protein
MEFGLEPDTRLSQNEITLIASACVLGEAA